MSDNQEPRRRRGPVIVVVVVAVLLVLTAAGMWVWKNLAPGNARTEHETSSYDDTTVTRLELVGNSGDVTVLAGDTDTVVVERELVWTGDKPRSEEQVVGELLTITETGCDTGMNWLDRCHIDYRIQVPADLTLDIAIDSGDLVTEGVAGDQKLTADSGAITVKNAGGAVDVDADSGDISVEGAAGVLDATADSGQITASGLTGDSATVEAESGDIDLRFDVAPTRVSAIADSGEITVRVPDDGQGYHVTVDVDSGDKKVTVPEDATSDHTIEVEADSGDISVLTG